MPLFVPTIALLALGTEDLGLLGGQGVMVANTVYAWSFITQTAITINALRWRNGTTATGTSDVGVYDSGNNLLVHSGVQTNSSNTTTTFTLATPLLIGPGSYYLALCPSNSTDTYSGIATTPGDFVAGSSFRSQASGGSSGVLPNTLGATVRAGSFPSIAAVLAGGLS